MEASHLKRMVSCKSLKGGDPFKVLPRRWKLIHWESEGVPIGRGGRVIADLPISKMVRSPAFGQGYAPASVLGLLKTSGRFLDAFMPASRLSLRIC